jgi:hypothetical protein
LSRPAISGTDIKGINEKAAALLGTTSDQILINDVKVDPISKNVYLSVSRGRGPDAVPVVGVFSRERAVFSDFSG